MTAFLRFLEALCILTVAHVLVRFAHFSRLQRLLSVVPAMRAVSGPQRERVIEETCTAVRRARRYYVTDVKCLPSAATCTCILRLRGLPAQLTIGVRSPPFEAHAWTVLDGAVINDDEAVTSTYSVITRV